MSMEMGKFENKLTDSDKEVLTKLEKRLIEIRSSLGKADENENPSQPIDDEDLVEDNEEKERRQALGNELEKEELEIIGAIKWIGEHGDVCAFAGCDSKVGDRRRQADPASITCAEHREEEDRILRELHMGINS